MATDAEQAFAHALAVHRHGRLGEAERLYRQVLAGHPNHLDALNLLGVLALQTGRNEEAINYIARALAQNDRVADFHNNIAEAYRRVGRLDPAVTHFAKATELEPRFVEAHLNLAATLRAQGKWDLAAARYRRLLEMRLHLAEAHSGLADTLLRQGQFTEAVAHYGQALALKPHRPEALCNLGIALKAQGQSQEAVAAFERAIVLKPDFPEALRNLAHALLEQGQFGRAADAARRAVELTDSTGDKLLFVACARIAPDVIADADGTLRTMLLRAWSELWGRPSDLAQLSVGLIKRTPAMAAAIARAKLSSSAPPSVAELWGPSGLAAPVGDRLFRYLIESALVGDADLERVLTVSRRIMLDAAASSPNQIADDDLAFCCALARQCFINEYVFACNEDELETASRLRDALVRDLQSGAPISPLWPVAVASYWPLHDVPAAEALLQRAWPPPLTGLLAQQIADPQEEMRSRGEITRLTRVEGDVSQQVRQQYEENPYPRWVDVARVVQPNRLQAWFSALFPDAPIRVEVEGDILIAGCGTGQQAIETAQRHPEARVLAIDLSLSSLAYAQRKTRALGLGNIEYAQADILQLASIHRTFDLIEAVGVLHHLADPLAGWRVLLRLLRPDGLMHVGLYSQSGRRHVVSARDLIAQRGYRPTAQDIRRCRQDLMAIENPPGRPNVAEAWDFFSISTCRDLLFHVAEHRITLPEIEAFLAAENLALVGLQLEAAVAARYRQRFPDDPAMTSLANWHAFELEHPHTFAGMYLFWVRRRGE